MLLIHSPSSWFFPVILSLHHSLPHLFCICPKVTVHCTGLSLRLSCSLPLSPSVYGCINAISTSSLRENSGFCCNCFSAGDNVCNLLSASRCHLGGSFLYSQADQISVCVYVCNYVFVFFLEGTLVNIGLFLWMRFLFVHSVWHKGDKLQSPTSPEHE